MSQKNTIIIVVAVIAVLALGIGGNYYLTKNKSTNPGDQNNQQNQGNNTDPLAPVTQEEKDFRAKVLVVVGKVNAGQRQEGLADYLVLEKENPNDLLLLNNIASLYSDFSNWAKSVEYYKKLIAVHPQYTPAYRMLGYIYWYHLGNDEVQIKTLFDVGLQLTDNNPDLASWMAEYYQQNNQADKAIPYSQIITNALNKK
jgi:tetratricopeptide (TPR) repeat protein